MLEEANDTVYSGFVLRARPLNEKLNNNFKAYCFSTNCFRKQIISCASYTTRALTSGRALSTAIIAIPPKSEQKSIASALGDVDSLSNALKNLITKKRTIKQITMQQLLNGKTRLPGFKSKWKEFTLGEHLIFLKNGINSRSELSDNEGVRYLHYGDIHASPAATIDARNKQIPSLSHDKASQLDRLQTGDLIFVDASEDTIGIGKSIEIKNAENIEIVSGLHTIAVRFDKRVLMDGFKSYLQFIQKFQHHLQKLAAGTKVYATNRSHISTARLQLPDVDEQVAISSLLFDMESEITALEVRYSKILALKQAMMQELLTGRKRLI